MLLFFLTLTGFVRDERISLGDPRRRIPVENVKIASRFPTKLGGLCGAFKHFLNI